MTIDDQRTITMFRSYKLMTDSIKALRDNLKRTVPDLDVLELEQVSGKLHHLSVLLNGLYVILGYDSPDEAFADVVDYDIDIYAFQFPKPLPRKSNNGISDSCFCRSGVEIR